MGTTSPIPAMVRTLATENEALKVENGQLKADQSAALELIVEQESRIAALTGQVAVLAGQVAAVTPAPDPPPEDPPAAPVATEPALEETVTEEPALS